MNQHPHQNSTTPKTHYVLVKKYIDNPPIEYEPNTSQIRYWGGLVHIFNLQGFVSENNYTALAKGYKHSHSVARQILKSHIANGFIKEAF